MGDYLSQADFARRIGKIAKTYQQAVKIAKDQDRQEELYEATLHICLLHTLLTSCKESLQQMMRSKRLELSIPLSENSIWGLTRSMVQTNFVNEPIDLEAVIVHMRHAVSHPSPWKVIEKSYDPKYPPTGFHRSQALDGQIKAYMFIDSPDVKSNGGRRSPIYDENSPHPRVFKIEVPFENLQEFVQELSCFLYEHFDDTSVPHTR